MRAVMAAQGLVACQPRRCRTTTVPGPGPSDQFVPAGRDRHRTRQQTHRGYHLCPYLGRVRLRRDRDRLLLQNGPGLGGGRPHAHLAGSRGPGHGRRHQHLQPRCTFHSDRGTQNASAGLAAYLRVHDMRGSMGPTGIWCDNAMAESVFAALNNELVQRAVFPTIGHLRKAVASYIEVSYHHQRLHSALGYRNPAKSTPITQLPAQQPEHH